MTTITAKQLRDNLEEILQRVQDGEEIALTYRDKLMAKLVPEPKPRKRGTPGLDALNVAPRKGYKFDPDKTYKELYDESLREKYGKYVS